MALVNAGVLVRHAVDNKYAIACINTNGGTYDLVRAITEVAQEENAPVILAAYEGNLAYQGFEYAALLMNYWAERVSVPVATHFDHGSKVGLCHKAIEAGFSSVMIDGSQRPIDENITMVNEVLAMAEKRGVSVEAEVGELQRLGPDGETAEAKNLSDPNEVDRISRETAIDMLAVGIGNAHGFYKDTPNIRTDLLAELSAVSKVPLVLHGTTGLADDIVRSCIELGVAKVNLGTLIITNYVKYIAEAIRTSEHPRLAWQFSQTAKDCVKEDIRRFIRLTGSSGQATKIQL